eukprot:CAMPEP_0173057870 /NCGR_PEP_ID=MMETSP1102-20130122/1016_1 /TAXON_ID=49646 /ORGANISM="Geminigera sp., Strain Caron Lab Isolate" /LENGTH=87 /DNA_ID=CAMNT_0013923505 /DNA_START=665 /DNA_END=925 /DNA_ORIENTATION=-
MGMDRSWPIRPMDNLSVTPLTTLSAHCIATAELSEIRRREERSSNSPPAPMFSDAAKEVRLDSCRFQFAASEYSRIPTHTVALTAVR